MILQKMEIPRNLSWGPPGWDQRTFASKITTPMPMTNITHEYVHMYDA